MSFGRLNLVYKARVFVESQFFQRSVIGAILVSAALIGLETSAPVLAKWGGWLKLADKILLAFFCVELGLKIISRGSRPWQFFLNAWNVFDFVVVAVCLLPTNSQYLVVLRLLRVLRVLRLITAVPKLQLLVGALFKSIPSLFYVLLLLSVHFYIYAVLGTFLFGSNDRWHFGSLGASLLTLFQIITLEGWVEIMLIQVKGCSEVGADSLRSVCTSSIASPLGAPLYFISFIIFGTMIILNLFIGVVVNSMSEMAKEIEGTSNQNRGPFGEVQNDIVAIQNSLNDVLERISKLARDR